MNKKELKELLTYQKTSGMYIGVERSDARKLNSIFQVLNPRFSSTLQTPSTFHGKWVKSDGLSRRIMLSTTIEECTAIISYIFCKRSEFLEKGIIENFNLNSFYIWRDLTPLVHDWAWEEINDLEAQLITRTLQL